MNTCKVENCDRDSKIRGYCIKHYHHWRLQNQEKICSVQDCDDPVHAKGYCRKHYVQIWRHGHVKKVEEFKQTSLISEYLKVRDIYDKVIGIDNRIRLRKELQKIEEQAASVGIHIDCPLDPLKSSLNHQQVS
jgi:hypothetical protein